MLAQAQRSHVSPDLFDVLQTFGLHTGFTGVKPTECILAIGRPNRVLLFVVEHNFIDCLIFCVISVHLFPSDFILCEICNCKWPAQLPHPKPSGILMRRQNVWMPTRTSRP